MQKAISTLPGNTSQHVSVKRKFDAQDTEKPSKKLKEVTEGCSINAEKFGEYYNGRYRVYLIIIHLRIVESLENPPEFSTHPHTKNPKNAWILDVYNKWISLPMSVLPNQQAGKDILLELLKMEGEILQRPNSDSIRIIKDPEFNSGIIPSFELLLQDIIESSKSGKSMSITDCTNGFYELLVPVEKLLASLFCAASAKEWKPNMRLYSAMDIEVSTTGLGLCDIKPKPFQNDPTFSFSAQSSQGDPSWMSVLTPPGSITHTYSDGIGSCQYMVHFKGEKLWLFWPLSEKNLSLYAHQHGKIRKPTMTLESIRQMEGMQVYYLEDNIESFVIPPSYLHAVISFMTSAHTAAYFCGYDYFDELTRMMSWFLQWAKDFSVIGHTMEESCQALKQLQDKIVWWEVSTKANERDPRTPKIQGSLQEIKDGAKNLMKTLSGNTKNKVKQSRKVVHLQSSLLLM